MRTKSPRALPTAATNLLDSRTWMAKGRKPTAVTGQAQMMPIAAQASARSGDLARTAAAAAVIVYMANVLGSRAVEATNNPPLVKSSSSR